jgi:hypothetical protein
MSFAWVGFFLALNSTQPVRQPMFTSVPAVEATAIVRVNKLTVTSIFIRPLRPEEPMLTSVSIGWRLF